MTETYEEFLKDTEETKKIFYSVGIIKGEALCAERFTKYNIYSWGRDLLERQFDLSEDQVCYIIKNLKRTAAGYMRGPAELDINHVTVVADKSIGFDTIEDLVNFDFSGMHLYRITRQGGMFVVRCGTSYKG